MVDARQYKYESIAFLGPRNGPLEAGTLRGPARGRPAAWPPARWAKAQAATIEPFLPPEPRLQSP